MLVMCTVLALLTKTRTFHIMILTKLAWHSHMRISHHQWWFINHHRRFIRSPHREPTVSSQLPLIARASHSPPGIETFFPLVLKHFFPVVLKHWNTTWYKKNQACGRFSNSYCPFQHSTFPTLICLQQSSLSRFKKDNFYIVDLHWLFESEHDLK